MKNSYRRSKIFGICFSVVGVLMLVFSVGLAVYNSRTENIAEEFVEAAVGSLDPILTKRKDDIKIRLADGLGYVPDYILAPDMEMPIEEIDGNKYIGTIDVPELGLHLPVLSELTDASLKISPSRMQGTVYKKDIIIGAHNYRYHFGSLKNLAVGDELIFTDVDGNEFHYDVSYTEMLYPNQMTELEAGDWDLTLFTCTIGGAQRVVARFELIG